MTVDDAGVSAARRRRKGEHLEWADRSYVAETGVLTDVRLVPDGLDWTDPARVDTRTSIGGIECAWPVMIGPLTGGQPGGEELNATLARVAARCSVPIAVGSQRAALGSRAGRAAFETVRANHPGGVVFANLSASCTPAEAREAVAMIAADGIQLHLNGMQELLMPEGERHAVGLSDAVARIVEAVDVPVIVKEVGFGMSGSTVRRLEGLGAAAVDIAGRGGTSFASIESGRAGARDTFRGWGIPTAVSVAEAVAARSRVDIIASGGMRSGLDVLKCLVMGACTVSFAGEIAVQLMRHGEEAAARTIEMIQSELRIGMAALGVADVKGLQDVEYVVTGQTREWLAQRGVEQGRRRRA